MTPEELEELEAIELRTRAALEQAHSYESSILLTTIVRLCDTVREQDTVLSQEPAAQLAAPPGAHPRFWELTSQMRAIHVRKARDYGELDANGHNHLANMKRSLAMGISPATAAMIRMSDKWSRVQTLYARRLRDGGAPAVADESLSDTLVDLASYALLALILMEEEKS